MNNKKSLQRLFSLFFQYARHCQIKLAQEQNAANRQKMSSKTPTLARQMATTTAHAPVML